MPGGSFAHTHHTQDPVDKCTGQKENAGCSWLEPSLRELRETVLTRKTLT
jgi:hypothetical protein